MREKGSLKIIDHKTLSISRTVKTDHLSSQIAAVIVWTELFGRSTIFFIHGHLKVDLQKVIMKFEMSFLTYFYRAQKSSFLFIIFPSCALRFLKDES